MRVGKGREIVPFFCGTDTIAGICSLNKYALLLSFRSFVHGNFMTMHAVTRQFCECIVV